jgi:hypothetical protein
VAQERSGTTWASTQGNVTHDGVDAAQSGAIPDSASSYLQTTVTGPGTLSFWWNVSSEANNDTLRFQMNGSEQARISGEVDWQQHNVTLPAGDQTIQWSYTKDPSLAMGQDSAWVDQVQFIPTPPCPVTLSPGSASYPFSSSTGMISVAAASDCTWHVFNTNTWISTVPGTNGTGNGSVTYVVAANPKISIRSGNIRIADQLFLITQSGTNPPSGCTNSISPTGRTHDSAAVADIISVTTQEGCPWSVFNTNTWVTILSTVSNSGGGQVVYSISSNTTSVARSGNILIGGQLFSISQSGTPCTYFMSPTIRAHSYGGTP